MGIIRNEEFVENWAKLHLLYLSKRVLKVLFGGIYNKLHPVLRMRMFRVHNPVIFACGLLLYQETTLSNNGITDLGMISSF